MPGSSARLSGSRAWVAVLLLVLPVWAGDDASERRGRWEVVGASGAEERYVALRSVVERARSEACERLASELGIEEAASRPIVWQLEAAPGVVASPPSLNGAVLAGRTLVGAAGVRVLLPAWRYLSRPQAAVRVVAHEACHGVLASRLGEEQYRALPVWFREGLALWFAGEGAQRVDERIALTVFAGSPADSFLRGVSLDAGGAPVSYAESFLAFEYLRGSFGRGRLAELLTRLVSRSWTLSRALRELHGLPESRWVPAALAASRQRVRERLPAEAEARFASSLVLRRRRKMAAAEDIWRQLRKEDPSGPLASTLDYLVLGTRLERARENPAMATDLCAALLQEVQAGTHLWQPELLIFLGDTYRLRGAGEAAAAAYREVVEAHRGDAKSRRRALARLEALARPAGEPPR